MWGENQNCAVLSMRGKIMISAHKGSTRILYIYTNNMNIQFDLTARTYSNSWSYVHVSIFGLFSCF